MGARQSGPAANGRTRAYSGSDLPSATGGGNNRAAAAMATRYHHNNHHHHHHQHHHHHAHGGSASGGATSSGASPQHNGPGAARAAGGSGGRSSSRPAAGINIPNSGGVGGDVMDGERERSDGGQGGPRLLIGSLPAHLSPHLFGGFKCPVCSKFVSTDEMDLHLVMCLTKPRVTYNEDVLTKDAGECAICLEELTQGDTIARLPCLCIYHKGCIDEWFEVNRSCPEHPSD
ncbi:unnamed protein product [Merluccius merluccius]